MTNFKNPLNNLSSNFRKRGAWIGAVAGAVALGGLLYFFMTRPSTEQDQHEAVQTAASPVIASPVAQAEAPVAPAMPSTKATGYFAFNSAELGPEMQASLDDWAKRMSMDQTLTLQLEGHCDERGTKTYNMHLGQQRADAAKDYLVAKGVESRRLTAVSYGESRPVADGHDEEAWSQNRRVEFHTMDALSQNALPQR